MLLFLVLAHPLLVPPLSLLLVFVHLLLVLQLVSSLQVVSSWFLGQRVAEVRIVCLLLWVLWFARGQRAV